MIATPGEDSRRTGDLGGRTGSQLSFAQRERTGFRLGLERGVVVVEGAGRRTRIPVQICYKGQLETVGIVTQDLTGRATDACGG